MKYLAAQYQGNQKLQLVEKEIPILGEQDVLIRIAAATICGTDFKIIEGNFPAEPPVVIGHEFSGYVEEVGSGVKSVRPNDLVTIEPHIFCGLCKYCRIGKEHLCANKKGFGVRLDGGFAEYCVIPEKTVYKIPDYMSSSVAALTENVGCCIHGIERAKIDIGDHVAILGGGFAGIVLAELARMNGAGQVYIIEPNSYRLAEAKKRGFLTIDPTIENVADNLLRATHGLGADVVIEAAGRIETARQAMQLICKGGTILFFGVVPPNEFMEFSPNDIFLKELTVLGSHINPYSHYKALEIIENLNLESLITARFNLEQIEDAFIYAKSGRGFKVAVYPHGVPI
ncbi:zinc-dependent alcohol dehydrogenase family protein [Bacillus sp. FJAT-50079]|uniref:zinc-dependent alcohol dehydrogenase family protein n=1 Tax=Bacillus sp. FJAT-50079 TaxID=2833577 RepID=UPI001BC967F4|nr:zinc-dependent alcohol dehydrogenase family protein [Bacillus sp. FJAT-50079]MBS4206598.1 zinc-dependent alcohol dehydrogenase family protein [Bacillus sp. FJAT-50079]